MREVAFIIKANLHRYLFLRGLKFGKLMHVLLLNKHHSDINEYILRASNSNLL